MSNPAINDDLPILDLHDLAREIAMRMDPDALLDSDDVGAMLKCPARAVTEDYARAPGFPKAYRLTKRTGRSQPRWKRSEVQSWIDSHKNGATRRGGRPRNNDD